MIRAKVLPEVLSQILSPSVHVVLLMSKDGLLLGKAGSSTVAGEEKIVGAIIANFWTEYEKASQACFSSDDATDIIMLKFENGKLCAVPVASNYLLCAYGDNLANWGDLRLKMDKLKHYFDSELVKIEK